MWLTDMVAMPNVNMIAVSSTERDISEYTVWIFQNSRTFGIRDVLVCKKKQF